MSGRHSHPIDVMHAFQRLPPELLPCILEHLRYRQGELARASLVCREWARISKPLIWEWVRTRDSDRIEKAFSALSQSPELCSFVRELEVRVYPLASLSKLEQLEDEVLETFRHATNLRSLVWTRKGSLRAEVLDAICQLPQLEKLELNATPAGGWAAEQLLSLPSTIKSLSLLLPNRDVISYSLPGWLEARRQGSVPGLRNLSIICLESPVVNHTTLAELSPHFSSLTSLTLSGCTRVGDDDVLLALRSCKQLKHLALEAVSISVDFYSKAAPLVPDLLSLRTRHPGRRHPKQATYYEGLSQLVAACPRFQSFTHYLSGDTERGWHPEVAPDFVQRLVNTCGDRLIRFEVSGLSMSLESVREICFGARKLRQLVVPVPDSDLNEFRFYTLGLTSLRSLHIVSPATTVLQVSLARMLDLVKHSTPTLLQIGFQNRVRSIGREVVRGDILPYEEQEMDPTAPWFVRNGIRVSLQQWDEPLGVWPEALLVVRT